MCFACRKTRHDENRGISFRKADEREARKYGRPKTIDG